jgi:hypothetical protein
MAGDVMCSNIVVWSAVCCGKLNVLFRNTSCYFCLQRAASIETDNGILKRDVWYRSGSKLIAEEIA